MSYYFGSKNHNTPKNKLKTTKNFDSVVRKMASRRVVFLTSKYFCFTQIDSNIHEKQKK